MKTDKGHIPVRMCISCRSRRNKNALFRLIYDGHGTVVLDRNGKGQGRGAYICFDKSCLDKLEKMKNLNKVFKVDTAISLSPDFGAESKPNSGPKAFEG